MRQFAVSPCRLTARVTGGWGEQASETENCQSSEPVPKNALSPSRPMYAVCIGQGSNGSQGISSLYRQSNPKAPPSHLQTVMRDSPPKLAKDLLLLRMNIAKWTWADI